MVNRMRSSSPKRQSITYLNLTEYQNELEFMFMKHYVPNRCEPSIEALNFGGDQGRCERRSEVFVKLKKNNFFFFGGGGGSGPGGGGG